MNPRKRQAPELLLPQRAPKQPRTALKGYRGGNPSPSQQEGLLSRWISLGKKAWCLGCETVSYLVPGSTTVEELPYSYSPSPSPPPPPPPPSIPPPPASYDTSKPPPNPPRKIILSRTRMGPPTAPALPDKQQPGRPKGSAGSLGNAVATMSALNISGPSKQRVEPPQLRKDEPTLVRRIGTNSFTGIPRPYQNREHILAGAHKARVQATLKQDREEMQKELYRYKRRSGYSSDYPTFLNFVKYGETLEQIQRRETLPLSPSLGDLRALYNEPNRTRRHSYDEIRTTFLDRALENARLTMNAPPPPKQFTPALEHLDLLTRTRNAEIDRRIRGPSIPSPPSQPLPLPLPQPLPSSLPPSEEAQVDAILAKKGVVAKFSKEQVTDRDLGKLRPGQWLNDEVVNFYGSLILARSEGVGKGEGNGAVGGKENAGVNGAGGKKQSKPLNVHYFSTFFWSKLKEGYDKSRLAKWTKKIDIFQKDVLLIPINHNNSHWTGAAINFRRKRIESYDSMGMPQKNVFKLLRLYLDAEHKNKKKKPFDFTGWTDYTSEDTPQQENCYDCGVFTCQFLESLSRGEESFGFTQKDMPYLRRRMIWEIGNTTLASSGSSSTETSTSTSASSPSATP